MDEHVPVLKEKFGDLDAMTHTPASQLDADDVNALVQKVKDEVKDIDADCKDAKKRVALVKGPQKKKKNKNAELDAGEVSGADSEES